MAFFLPDAYFERVSGITPSFLEEKGIRGLLLDVDNTLALHNDPDLPPFVSSWLKTMRVHHIAMIIVSNNSRKRVAPFAKKVGLPFISMAWKPLPWGFSRGIRQLGLRKSETAAVGDQLYTDLVGAKFCRITAILLDPIREESSGFLAGKRRKQKRWLKKHHLRPQKVSD